MSPDSRRALQQVLCHCHSRQELLRTARQLGYLRRLLHTRWPLDRGQPRHPGARRYRAGAQAASRKGYAQVSATTAQFTPIRADHAGEMPKTLAGVAREGV